MLPEDWPVSSSITRLHQSPGSESKQPQNSLEEGTGFPKHAEKIPSGFRSPVSILYILRVYRGLFVQEVCVSIIVTHFYSRLRFFFSATMPHVIYVCCNEKSGPWYCASISAHITNSFTSHGGRKSNLGGGQGGHSTAVATNFECKIILGSFLTRLL